jgi:hypothetical protein
MEGLLECLEEKRKLLGELHAEVQRQAAFIAAGDLDGLQASIEARQRLMDAIDRIDGRLPRQAGSSAFSGDAKASKLLEEIGSLLGEIIAADNENRKNAGALAESIMSGLRETRAEKSLLAYAVSPPAESKFVNRKG